MTLRIGELAASTATTPPTIRYYESIGLLPPPTRVASGQRLYSSDDVDRLRFIRRCREVGFSVAQVRTLLDVATSPERSCQEVRTMTEDHLGTIRARLNELRALERTMAGFVASCTDACSGGPGPACVPLRAMARPTEIQA